MAMRINQWLIKMIW